MKGKKGLVVGIANEHSIAWGCAHALHEDWSTSCSYVSKR